MNVDVSFQFAKVYNIERFDVVKGQKFSLFTDSPKETVIKWFANNDSVLSIDDENNSADVEALDIGTSQILLMDANLLIVKRITIQVVTAIVEPATELGIKADDPVLK